MDILLEVHFECEHLLTQKSVLRNLMKVGKRGQCKGERKKGERRTRRVSCQEANKQRFFN
jgi:hypothetical protein